MVPPFTDELGSLSTEQNLCCAGGTEYKAKTQRPVVVHKASIRRHKSKKKDNSLGFKEIETRFPCGRHIADVSFFQRQSEP